MTAVEIRDLFQVYSTPEGDAAALQGLTLSVAEHEVLSILGPSGSGKTSLLRILAGLERPSAGTVRVFGANVGRLSGRALASYRSSTLGYADQHYDRALSPELSARELVALELGLRGATRAARLARADDLLGQVGLAEQRDRLPHELSGGEQQRVALCAALAHGPRLFLADEPTGELDADSAALVYRVIGDLTRSHGCTTVIVSHDPRSAEVADRTVRIRDGRVSEEFTREAHSTGAIVVGRGGWLRLPEELLLRAGIQTRATAQAEAGAIILRATGEIGAPVPAPAAPRSSSRSTAPSGVAASVHALAKTLGSGPGATAVFSGLDAALRRSRLTAVTGPSGSGKTTFLQLLAGLQAPDAGEIEVLGVPLSGLGRDGRAELRRRHVGFVGQQLQLVPFLSAQENVELGLAIRGVEPAQARRLALEALEAVGLAERSQQRVSRLSTGERGRVAVARALAPRPELLLADEPTSRLDQPNALAVSALLGRLAREWHAAVVVATHDPVVIEQADEELALGAPAPRR